MKTKSILHFLILALVIAQAIGCKKDELAESQTLLQKNWKLDHYLINGVDKTATIHIAGYDESYSGNGSQYVRNYTDKNGRKVTETGTYELQSAARIEVSGVGSIDISSEGTVSSSYYDVSKLTEGELWYFYTNGSQKHEFRLSRK